MGVLQITNFILILRPVVHAKMAAKIAPMEEQLATNLNLMRSLITQQPRFHCLNALPAMMLAPHALMPL